MTRLTHNHLKSRAWAAIFVLLLQALFPAIVYASSPKDGYAAEVCTAFGIKKVVSQNPSTPDGVAHQQHCPFCFVAHLLALPNSPATFSLPDVVARDSISPVDSQQYQATRLRPHVRGPPARNS